MSQVESKVGPRPANSIQSERTAIDFDIDLLNVFLEGSYEEAAIVQELMQQIERDPILKVDSSYYELNKSEHREVTARKIAQLSTYMERDAPDYDKFQKRLGLLTIIDPQLGTRIGIHLGLFLSALKGNGTDEQFQYWAFDTGAVFLKNVYGCFAMTELAHGSNVAGLETTATFDKDANQFIINTPHIGATKWWIGGAAHSSTHAVVYARLIVNNEDHGVKTFVVPLRDADHNLNPGVAIGDIGAKMGRDGIDNGWIQFSSVVIPREYMLTKYTRIDEDGEVIEPPLAQLAYGALLTGRVTMVRESFRTSQRFMTVALRYAVGRRQFAEKNSEDNAELQLIDYPLHQLRLIPWLAFTYALACGSERLTKEHVLTIEILEAASRSEDFTKIGKAIEKLKNIFISSGMLKSACTWFTANLIDEARQSCGGHGYSSYSGFGKAYNDWVVQCTWEGDNNVLAMSVGRALSQALIKAQKGKKIEGDLSFINDYKQFVGKDVILGQYFDLKVLLICYKAVLIRLADYVVQLLPENNNNWDLFGAEKVTMSKLNAIYYLLEAFIDRINKLSDKGNIKPYLVDLAKLFALSNIDKFSGIFLQFNVISSEQLSELSFEIKRLNKHLRTQVIGLTDAFKFSDTFINSALGSYDGDIYNNYFDIVKMQNKEVKAPYSEVLEKMLHRAPLENREYFQKSKEVLNRLGKL
ncbi:hypothetical protein PACTADRAFT_38273 [Pachysolen tannophilus NRRL Y-2460]|uniref:Acyl-coenzyme A oxidase n=1 Tax=Pachysolen tannophilus NRRL Y-2460 TaxID=669874 RepID=A0A1E4U358_PACTA|nr:hypothetical protein PACTADRAFT_38273 [Pachysolen tannophilus NRRL Y-2460]